MSTVPINKHGLESLLVKRRRLEDYIEREKKSLKVSKKNARHNKMFEAEVEGIKQKISKAKHMLKHIEREIRRREKRIKSAAKA